MQINEISKATVIEFKWQCGCRHIIEKSECGKFRVKETCGNPHQAKLNLDKAKRSFFN
jgi:hypothetical protein